MITEGGTRLGKQAARRLVRLDCCVIEAGLTDAEFARIEREYGFEFADDHRAFLAAGLPVHEPREEEPDVSHAWERPWPDWRNGDPDELRNHLDWPIDFLLSDIRRGHWPPGWDARPDSGEAAVDLARSRLAEVPRMVPVYAHRFLPAGRGAFGHPVLSMRGHDIISYGADLLDYIDQEFEEPRPEYPDSWPPEATVPFWRDYAREND
ncbi:hypothetical protein [Actinomadura atramentaria]|uniref:hypothetical protein n=1 Tax=Actinomadura atramentaria TaxID=1990 RepID=UPI0003625466|nr:hypothetical protein [Actinomadura atramentaria]